MNRARTPAARDRAKLNPEVLAQLFHDTYERLAPEFGYTSRRTSAVPWADVPEPNKSLMIATAKQVLRDLGLAGRLQPGWTDET